VRERQESRDNENSEMETVRNKETKIWDGYSGERQRNRESDRDDETALRNNATEKP
jgi:hypothetical protein